MGLILTFCRSDTESAENHKTDDPEHKGADGEMNGKAGGDADGANPDPEGKKDKLSMATRMSNFFSAMKKSVNVKSNKDKYGETDSEMKVPLIIITLIKWWLIVLMNKY